MFSCETETYLNIPPKRGYPVTFKSCFVNKHDGSDGHQPMDIETGRFFAPIAGFYEFHFYGNGVNGKDTEILVRVNGITRLKSFLDADQNNADDFLQLSFHCILYLEKDDDIQLFVPKGQIWAEAPHNEFESVFTGKLVQKMK